MAYNSGKPKPFQARGSEEKPGTLPEGYLAGGYYEGCGPDKVLKKEYIVEYPQNIAAALSREADRDGSKKNRRSQIRKFYEYTLRIRDLVRRNGNNFRAVEAELDRLLPFAQYKLSRNTVSELFVEFIKRNVQNIKNEDDLLAFVKHFEAIVAYLPKEKN